MRPPKVTVAIPHTTGPILRVVEETAPVATEPQPSGRALAIALFAVTLAVVGWIATTAYRVITDAWIAPLHLTPDNDAVGQLRLAHAREQAELARLDAEGTRLAGELSAIDDSITALKQLQPTTIAWQANQAQVEADGLAAQRGLMDQQLASLHTLYDRQLTIVAKAQSDLAAGLIERSAVDKEEQTRDQFALEITDLQRQQADAKLRADHTADLLKGFHSHAKAMPEVAAGDEHVARIAVEISRLESEARGDRALRDAAVHAAETQRQLLAELEGRPLYRAMTSTTDIAFVPYTQLEKLHPGADVIACAWSVFACHAVGHVSEVLPGEVVTQDPWGELARGQYAVLELDDPDAIQERVLRVR
ncbi:MAG: hypothetical protein QM831_40445 [Kofleriaceae bacterium]